MLLGLPAAYTLAFHPGPRNNFTLMWLMSTRMLPPVGVILPLYILPRDPSRPVLLRVDLDYAICLNLCIPADGKAELLIGELERAGAVKREAGWLVPC